MSQHGYLAVWWLKLASCCLLKGSIVLNCLLWHTQWGVTIGLATPPPVSTFDVHIPPFFSPPQGLIGAGPAPTALLEVIINQQIFHHIFVSCFYSLKVTYHHINNLSIMIVHWEHFPHVLSIWRPNSNWMAAGGLCQPSNTGQQQSQQLQWYRRYQLIPN